MKLIKFKCGHCGSIFVADTQRWHMDYCPKCGKTGVDLEEYCCRLIADKKNNFPKQVDKFEPPFFDDEELYHSALLTWLNDSCEEFELYKPEKLLYIIKKG